MLTKCASTVHWETVNSNFSHASHLALKYAPAVSVWILISQSVLESWQDTAVKMFPAPNLCCLLFFIFRYPCWCIMLGEINAKSREDVHGVAPSIYRTCKIVLPLTHLWTLLWWVVSVSLSKLLISFPYMRKSSVLVKLGDVTLLGKGGTVGVKSTKSPSNWDTSCCQRSWKMSLDKEVFLDWFISRAYNSVNSVLSKYFFPFSLLFIHIHIKSPKPPDSNLLRRAKLCASHLFYLPSKMLWILSCLSRRKIFLPYHNRLPSHTTGASKGWKGCNFTSEPEPFVEESLKKDCFKAISHCLVCSSALYSG